MSSPTADTNANVAAPATTNTVGFFNPNDHPVSLHSSKLGLANLIVQPNKFITDERGNQINDPALEAFVGPHMLAKQISDEPVPVISFRMRPPGAPAPMGAPGFSGSRQVPASMRPGGEAAAHPAPRAPLPPRPRPPTARIAGQPVVPVAPQAGYSPVAGMTMAEARARGLVAPNIIPAPEGIEDVPGRDVGKAAPYIGIARDAGVKRQPPPAARMNPPPPVPPAVMKKGGIAERLAKAAARKVPDVVIDPVMEEATARAAAPEEAAPPVEEATPPVERPLPEPRLPPAPVGESPPQAAGTEKFVCVACGRAFGTRNHLQQHAKGKHPAQLGAVMAPYPKG